MHCNKRTDNDLKRQILLYVSSRDNSSFIVFERMNALIFISNAKLKKNEKDIEVTNATDKNKYPIVVRCAKRLYETVSMLFCLRDTF